MTIDNQTLATLFSEIENEFLQDTDITIAVVSGDPPSEYEITFDLPCATKDEQGNIEITTGHVISMSIPFGFPHFPPSCKPKSPIFHPDFDNSAICLGDFWSNTPSVTELIHHLKIMISGHSYSLDNAFNNEAAGWYRENQHQLPFVSHSKSDSGLPPELELDEQQLELNTVEEADFADDFSFDEVSLEPQLPQTGLQDALYSKEAQQASRQLHTLNDFDIERFNLLASKRHFQELDAELAALPATAQSEEILHLARLAATAMEKASALYQKALVLQQHAEPLKALKYFHAVEQHVADFPNILERISALENELDHPAFEREHSSTLQQKKTTIDETARNSTPSDGNKDNGSEPKTKYSSAQKKDQHKPKLPRLRSGKPLLYGLAGLALLVTTAVSIVFYTNNSKLTAGRSLLQKCRDDIDNQQFATASQACLKAQEAAASIIFIHQDEVEDLEQQVHSLLSSKTLLQGLKGNVLFQGQYVPKATVAKHQELLDTIAAGTSAFDNSLWPTATAKLERAIELDNTLTTLHQDMHDKLVNQANYAALMVELEAVETRLAEKGSVTSPETLASLENKLNALPPQQAALLRKRLDVMFARQQFTTLKQQADVLLLQSDWPGALSLFTKAAEAGKLLSATDYPGLSDIQKNIMRAELYSAIEAGNTLFANGRWDDAIGRYRQAAAIVQDNGQFINSGKHQQSYEKLQRIILQATIIRDRQAAEILKEDNQLTAAITKLQKVVSAITASAYSDDTEFMEILEEACQATEQLKRTAFINGCTSYLVENYFPLVNKHYAAATEETISSPSAEFVKELDANRYLFQLQCTETGRGRPLKLVMYYTFDKNTNSWKFSSEDGSL